MKAPRLVHYPHKWEHTLKGSRCSSCGLTVPAFGKPVNYPTHCLPRSAYQ
jgi:hypothetical protein